MNRKKGTMAILMVLAMIFTAAPLTVFGALATATNTDPATAVDVLLSEGIAASNIVYNGSPSQLAVFEAPDDTLPITNGVVLSSGNASRIFTSTASNPVTNTLTNSDLNTLFNTPMLRTPAELMFDVTPIGDELSFSFFFMSSEYNFEITYNDVFALWVYDPTDWDVEKNKIIPQSNEKGLSHYNVARLPNGAPVTHMDTRGPMANYINNTMPYATRIFNNNIKGVTVNGNGYTDVLVADASELMDSNGEKLVQTGRTLRVRMAIANRGDNQLDSAVFIKADSVVFAKIYTVTFEDWNGVRIDQQDIIEGSGALAPKTPEREGYHFVGWDVDFSNITEDLIVTALYEINTYEVTFEDWDGTVLDTQTIEHGSAAVTPDNPTRFDHFFIGWDVDFSNITCDLTVTAQYVGWSLVGNSEAYGTKIASNAQSYNAGSGVVFYWDQKQKDNGVLEIAPEFFDAYSSLTVVVKSSNEYRILTLPVNGEFDISKWANTKGMEQNINAVWVRFNE
ncbi:MAG: InlB B-repeat-containing protein [Clostridiales bacterium]|nr:InlB B-repeat-containing protein [Clostridiales bacterium]